MFNVKSFFRFFEYVYHSNQEQKLILFNPEKLAFSFLVDFKFFDFLHFSSLFMSEGDFVAMITFLLSFRDRVANLGFSECFVGYSESMSQNEFKTFEKSPFSTKKNANVT